jgi:hypothetical protein
MTSYLCKPEEVRGPVKIMGFLANELGKIVLLSDSSGHQVQPWYVDDITNRWNGVFLCERDAREYFSARSLAYETDSRLIDEHRKAKLVSEEHHRQLEEDDDDDFLFLDGD